MANAFDVAAYILEKQGTMATWKLQKLVYYSQAWSLLWDDDVLFAEEIEAWANGPVVRELYEAHRHMYQISHMKKGDIKNLTPDQRETVEAVLELYGDKSPQWLSELVQMETPWKNARRGVAPNERGNVIIPKADLAEYYGSL